MPTKSPLLAAAALLVACGSSEPSETTASTSGAGGASTTASSSTSGSGGAGGQATGAGGGGGAGGAVGPVRLYGVTIDGIDPLPDIVESLQGLAHEPTTRIVFDEFVPASDYVDAATAIHGVSGVMGELLDSFYVALYSPAEYEARAVEYVSALGPQVDIWEIGNEINGEWVCAQNASSCTPQETADVVAKMKSAYDAVKQSGGKTALTLYYNQDCWSAPENEMFTWAAANVPADMKAGLDYVLVSYYEDDCNDLQPDWPSVFHQLATMFPSSSIGFGECGTTNAASKAEYVTRYYTTSIDEPRYVGGYFWWYFRQDMVPKSQPLWSVLNAAIAAP